MTNGIQYLSNIQYVRDRIPPSEVFAQLAEEAAELSQAASKTARILRGLNPTPVTLSESVDNIEEELADVGLCIDVIQTNLWGDGVTMRTIMDDTKQTKLNRWVCRLRDLYDHKGESNDNAQRDN